LVDVFYFIEDYIIFIYFLTFSFPPKKNKSKVPARTHHAPFCRHLW